MKIWGGIRMNGTERKNIRPGISVKIVQKQHQKTGQLTEGIVKDILTHSAVHHRGIKVRLDTGIIGRVQEILDISDKT
jgi:uncharacterized repeat protein (TIGR03833 family)